MLWGVVFITLSSIWNPVAAQGPFFFHNQTPSMADQYTVELLVVVDYSAYLKWYDQMTGPTPAVRKKHTLNAIWKHYSSVIHGIDSIFRGLEAGGLKISVEPVDIQVVSSDGIVTSRDEIIASEMALTAFYKWTQSDIKLPAFDHAMLITGYNLMENGDISKSGRAYLGTMCTTSSVSVVENDFSYEIVQITAHELGHSLGAKHDGEGNFCSPNDGYLMASVIEINSTRRWYLSPCSMVYIRNQIHKLTKERKPCLLINNHDNDGSVSIPMGELYTPDDQCKLIEGSGSYFCRDFYSSPEDYRQICGNIWCHVTDSVDNICNNYEGSDGYACGDMKTCSKGKCVFNEKAPSVPDYCPQGDQPGIVWKNYTCSQLVFFEPEMCYDDNTRSRCCLSCTEINSGIPGCEFGDKSSWCRNDLVVPMGCYKNENLCCGTCMKYKNHTRPKCPYGDKSIWCNSTMETPYGCYKNDDLCCGTCLEHYTPSRKGCEYGDRSTWCKTSLQTPYDCYKNSHLCCGTCPKYYVPENVGCEYGDRHKNCQSLSYPVGCYNNEDICCGTCRAIKDPKKIGCEYGDKSTWCLTDLDPIADCHLNLDLCCGTCAVQGSGADHPFLDTGRQTLHRPPGRPRSIQLRKKP